MTDQALLAAWGATTTAGYLATHAMGTAGTELFGLSVHGSIVAVWALLALVPVGMTVAKAARRSAGAHHWVWVGLVAAAMAANVGVAASGISHGHDGPGHGGSTGASAHGEPGHHGGSSGSESETTNTASGDAAGAQEPDDGHAHPNGGHGDDTSTAGAGGGDPGEGAPDGHAHPDGGHGGDTGPAASGTPGSPSASATSPEGGGAEHGGNGSGGFVDTAELQHAAFFHLWFLVGALGFAFSAAAAEGGVRRALYGLAAVLNALMVLALVAAPGTRDAAFLIAAAVQGLPMLLDLPLRAGQHVAA
ncbi:MAG: hypothetical protein AAGI91_13340 [Bacteroidota bacterium]